MMSSFYLFMLLCGNKKYLMYKHFSSQLETKRLSNKKYFLAYLIFITNVQINRQSISCIRTYRLVLNERIENNIISSCYVVCLRRKLYNKILVIYITIKYSILSFYQANRNHVFVFNCQSVL